MKQVRIAGAAAVEGVMKARAPVDTAKAKAAAEIAKAEAPVKEVEAKAALEVIKAITQANTEQELIKNATTVASVGIMSMTQ